MESWQHQRPQNHLQAQQTLGRELQGLPRTTWTDPEQRRNGPHLRRAVAEMAENEVAASMPMTFHRWPECLSPKILFGM